MLSQIQPILLALAASSLVAAHGKIESVTGDLGGKGTAFGIQGDVVPGSGPNYKTEVDTTVFWSKNIATDQDIGYTQGGKGNNQLASGLTNAMALSGDTLAQVSPGGTVSGVWKVVTADGCGPVDALIDATASAKWSTAVKATVDTTMPGTAGDCPAALSNNSGNQNKNKLLRLARRSLAKMGLVARSAANVNKNYDFSVAIPAGTTCTGTIGDQENLCLVKLSNNNANGPFGGVVAVQMGGNATTRRVVRSFRV